MQLEDSGPETRVAGMMSEILHHGPITCSISCPNDFTYNYDNGIFSDHKVR